MACNHMKTRHTHYTGKECLKVSYLCDGGRQTLPSHAYHRPLYDAVPKNAVVSAAVRCAANAAASLRCDSAVTCNMGKPNDASSPRAKPARSVSQSSEGEVHFLTSYSILGIS